MEFKSSGFRVQGAGFRVQGSGFRVHGSGFRAQGSGFRVQGSGFRVQGSGIRDLIIYLYILSGFRVNSKREFAVTNFPRAGVHYEYTVTGGGNASCARAEGV